ncbi:MAG: FecR family protein [Ginsengibacter sp.]
MRNIKRDLAKLIKKYVAGNATAEEIDFINLYYDEFENHPESIAGRSAEEKERVYNEMKKNILNHIQMDSENKVISINSSKKWIRVAAAASILLLVSFGLYFANISSKKHNTSLAEKMPVQINNDDVAPGGNIATLLLEDGTVINLDDAVQGHLLKQGNTEITKPGDGQLAFNLTKGGDQSIIKYNTVMTPRGGQYKLLLEDGSKVWLNSSSSIRFPATFNENVRKVEITGEVYFEIAKNTAKPFIVKVNNAEVKVYGTSFNINSYNDESAIKTTLLEGSVEVNSSNRSIMLVPGEEASLSHKNNSLSKRFKTNASEAIAWKEGYFQFDNADIELVMRQLARWYDLNVIYEGNISPVKFKGKIQRDLKLSDVLEFLKNDIHFERVGNTLIIKP